MSFKEMGEYLEPCIYRIKPNLYRLDIQTGALRRRVLFHGTLPMARNEVARVKTDFLDAKKKGMVLGGSLKSVGEVLEYYETYHYKKTARYQTYHGNLDELKDELGALPLFGDRRITPALVEGFLSRKEHPKEGSVPSPATITVYQTILSSAFNFAINHGMASENPTKGVKKRDGENIQRRLVSESEMLKIRDALPEYRRTWLEYIFKVPSRRGEVLGIRNPQDVFIQERMFNLPDPRTKTKRGRVMPIPASMLQRIMEIPKESPWVFPVPEEQEDGRIVYRRADGRGALQCLQRACERCEIDGVNIHAFRRTAAVRMIRAGVSLRAVQLIGGWANTKVLMSHYLPLAEEDLVKAVDMVDGERPKESLGDRHPTDTRLTSSEYAITFKMAS